jgi:hypothetical protein
MGLLNRRKNKSYDYEPRFFKSSDGSKPFEIKHKFDDHRTTVQNTGLKGKLSNAVGDFKQGSDVVVKNRIYIIVAVLVLIFLWLIEFDLTIFRGN